MSFQDQLVTDLGVFFSDFSDQVFIADKEELGLYHEQQDQWSEVQRPLRSISLPDRGQQYKSGDKVVIPGRSITSSVRSPPFRQGGLLIIPIK